MGRASSLVGGEPAVRGDAQGPGDPAVGDVRDARRVPEKRGQHGRGLLAADDRLGFKVEQTPALRMAAFAVREALISLKHEGFVRRVKDKGTFITAFETDEVADFLDLVQDLRETEASRYTLRDTPMFTCVAQPLEEILEAIGA